MANQATANRRAPCIPYKRAFELTDFEETTLQQSYDDGRTVKKKVPVYSGEQGIEGLLYVEERFRKAARRLEFTTGEELFDAFEECLHGIPAHEWSKQIHNLQANDMTIQRFNQEVQNFYTHFCDERARDTMYEYIDALKKPHDVDVREHANRLQQMIDYANKLPGVRPPKQEEEIKLMIFNTFPTDWARNFNRSGQRVTDVNLQDVLQYMADEKVYADADERNRRGRNQRRQGGRGSRFNRRPHNPFPNARRNDPCPRHGNNHIWHKCFDNPNGPNFRPERQRRDEPYQRRTGYQGRGRGQHGGRGFNGGRGNGGRGYGGRGFNDNNNNKRNEGYYQQQQSASDAATHVSDNNSRSAASTHAEVHHLDVPTFPLERENTNRNLRQPPANWGTSRDRPTTPARGWGQRN